MGQDRKSSGESPDLRKQAEARLKSIAPELQELSREEILALVHELQLQKIELEIQQEALGEVQAELEASASRSRVLFDCAPVGILTLDHNGVIVEANLTAAAQLGGDRGHLISKPFRFFIADDDIDTFHHCLGLVFQEPGLQPCEIRLKRQDGGIFYARLENLIVTDLSGGQECHTAITDISELKQAEQQLSESQRLFATFVEHLPGVAVIRDLEGRYLLVNAAWEQTFHTPPEKWQGKTIDDLWPPEVAAKFKKQDRQVIESGQALQTVGSLRHPDGWRHWITHRFPIMDSDGRPVMIGFNAFDITEAMETKMRLKQLLSFGPAAVYTCVIEGICAPTYISDNVKGLVGWEPRQFLENPRFWIKHVHPEDRRRVLQRLKLPWPQDHQSYEYRFLAKDGAYRWMHDDLKLVRDPDGQPVEIIGAWMDVTSRRQMEQELEEAHSRLRNLLQASPLPIVAMDREGRVTRWNPAAQQVFGWTEAEILGQPTPLVPPEGEAEFQELLARHLAGECFEALELKRRRKDGALLDVKLFSAPLFDSQGQSVGAVAVLEDITEAKQVREALRESEANFRLIFDQAPIGAAIVSLDYRFQRVNAELCRITGYTEAELTARTFLDLTHPEDGAAAAARAVRLAQGEIDHYQVEKRYIRKDGESVWVRVSVRLMRGRGSEPLYFLSMMEDITARHQFEQALHKSESQYRLLVNQLPAVVFKGYADWRVDFFDDKVEALTGYSKAEFDSRLLKWSDLVLPENREMVNHTFMKALKGDGSYVREYRIRKKNGEIAWIQALGQIFLNAAGRVNHVSGVFFDITARKETETNLDKERQRFFSLLDMLPALVCLMAPDGTLSFVNRKFRELFGDPQGRTCHEVIHGQPTLCHGCPVLPIVVTRQPLETERITSQGQAYHIYSYPFADIDGSPMILQLGMDITARKALEVQLIQSQKMEAIGRLAGGVAHDFNNLLMAIMGYGELMRTSLMKDDPLQKYCEDILKAGERAAALTQQLLAFSRRQIMQPQVVDLNRVMVNLEKMLRRLIGEDIDLEIVAGPELGSVKADPGQIEHIIMNLALNARDAMPAGGRFTLETNNVDFAGNHACFSEVAPPGRYVVLMVRDTGPGMTPETLTHIFEPFFTTKEVGQGSGLGLPMVYGIVKQNLGYVEIDSQPGQGTAFIIYLPRLDAAVEAPQAQISLADNLEGSETILVVEDEDALRNLLVRFFRLYGYNVLAARHGGEALLLCEGHQGPIHLMVTDVVMPQLSGPELAERLAPLYPEMKVVFMSGYPDRDLSPYGVMEPTQPFIPKPFKPMDLVKQVREFLDQPKDE